MFIFSICAFSTISQDKVPVNIDKTTCQKSCIDNKRRIFDEALTRVDTIRLNLKQGETLPIPIDSVGVTKVVMINEKSKFDFFNYLLPIFTLLLGIWIKEELDKRSNKRKIKKSGERWVAELRSLKEPLNQQIVVLKEFLIEHERENYSIPKISLFTSLDGEVFKSLDKNELIKYVEMKNRKSDFNEIVKITNRTHGYISIVVHLHETFKDKFNKYLAEISSYTDALTRSLQSFNLAFAKYGVEIETEINSNPEGDARYKPIADLYSAQFAPHLEDGKFNPFELKRDFFTPLLEFLSRLRLDPRTLPISIASSEALNSIKGIQMEKKYLSDNLKILIERYQKQSDTLDDIVNKIEKL